MPINLNHSGVSQVSNIRLLDLVQVLNESWPVHDLKKTL